MNSFLVAVGAEPSKLLTPDVLMHSLFLATLRNIDEHWHRFVSAESEYISLGQERVWKKSVLKESVGAAHDLMAAIGQLEQDL